MKNIILLRFHEHKNTKLNQFTSISKGAIFRVLHTSMKMEPLLTFLDIKERNEGL